MWELEGGFESASRKRLVSRAGLGKGLGLKKSVRIRPEARTGDRGEVDGGVEEGGLGGGEMGGSVSADEIEARKQWVGFDDEVVIVLKESGRGIQALMVYDFT